MRGGVEVTEESRVFADVVASALDLDDLRIVETGGSIYDSERQQWDSGNNLIAIEPGVNLIAIEPGVVGRERPQHAHKLTVA